MIHDPETSADRLAWLLAAIAGLLVLTGLVVDAHGSPATVAPDPPAGFRAAPALVERTVSCSCRHRPECIAQRGADIAEVVHGLAWVSAWYATAYGLPAHAAWWLPAQMCRESGGYLAIRGDNGLSVGALQLKPYWTHWWRRTTGRRLDRHDPIESGRVLMLAVARSYTGKVERWCGPQPDTDRRFRLAVARVGRGPVRVGADGDRVQRCDFWVQTAQGWREIAGVTARWAREWFGQGAGRE